MKNKNPGWFSKKSKYRSLILNRWPSFTLLSFQTHHQSKGFQKLRILSARLMRVFLGWILVSHTYANTLSGNPNQAHYKEIVDPKLEQAIAEYKVVTYRHEFAELMGWPALSSALEPSQGLAFLKFYITPTPRSQTQRYLYHDCHIQLLVDSALPLAYPGPVKALAGGTDLWPSLGGEIFTPDNTIRQLSIPRGFSTYITNNQGHSPYHYFLVSQDFNFDQIQSGTYFGSGDLAFFQKDYLPHLNLLDLRFDCSALYNKLNLQSNPKISLVLQKEGTRQLSPPNHATNRYTYPAQYYQLFEIPPPFIQMMLVPMKQIYPIDYNNIFYGYSTIKR